MKINDYLLIMKSLTIALFFFLIAVFVANAKNTTLYSSDSHDYISVNFYESDSIETTKEPVENIWDHLTIISDPRIDSLLQIHREENIRKKGLEGYRVQIFQGTKEEANKIKARFLRKYPDCKVYAPFQSPFFTVYVGDFRTKSEALKLQSQIKSEFSNSFIVEGPISFPELNKE